MDIQQVCLEELLKCLEIINISSAGCSRTITLQKNKVWCSKQIILLYVQRRHTFEAQLSWQFQDTPFFLLLLTQSYLLSSFLLTTLKVPFQAMKNKSQLNTNISCKFSARSILFQERHASLVLFYNTCRHIKTYIPHVQ